MSQSTLHKFFGGKQPPDKKSRVSEEDKKQNAKDYEINQRCRKFLESWKSGRPWLQFDTENGTLKCDICVKHCPTRDNNFVIGCKDLKLDVIKRHEGTIDHRKSAEKHSAITCKPGESQAEKAINSLTKAQNDRLSHLFRNAHALAKKARPYTEYVYLNQLDKAKGLEIGNQYLNRIQCKEFVAAIADVERKKIRDEFNENAKAFALMSDGSTDTSTTEEEILYIRYAKKGEVHVKFVGVKDVDKANAENISGAIAFIMQKTLGLSPEEWKKLMWGMTSDGATVMTGSEKGVVKLVTDGRKDVVTIHCLGHRLELAFKDAVKNIKLHADLCSLLITIFSFYRRSPLNKANLKAVFVQHKLKPIYPKRIGGTRWMEHFRDALRNFYKGYKPMICHLEQIIENKDKSSNAMQIAKAKGILKLAKNLPVVLYGYFLLNDVIPTLTNLSQNLQKSTLSLASVHDLLATTTTFFQRQADKPSEISAFSENKFHGIELNGDKNRFETARQNAFIEIQSALTRRTESMKHPAISATRILDFKNWPDKENNQDFGQDEIQVLVHHFHRFLQENQLDEHQTVSEWEILKVNIYAKDWNSRLANITWKEINRRYDHQLPNLLPLVDLILSLPSTSADCERGFSAMKHIKTEHRASLLPSALDDLLMVYLNSPPIEDFNPQPAINEWMKTKARRISKDDTSFSQVDTDSSDESDSDSVSSTDSIVECKAILD